MTLREGRQAIRSRIVNVSQGLPSRIGQSIGARVGVARIRRQCLSLEGWAADLVAQFVRRWQHIHECWIGKKLDHVLSRVRCAGYGRDSGTYDRLHGRCLDACARCCAADRSVFGRAGRRCADAPDRVERR